MGSKPKRARITIIVDIDASMAKDACSAIIDIVQKTHRDEFFKVQIDISSEGGSINHGAAILGFLNQLKAQRPKCKIITVATGHVCSEAVRTFLVGDYRIAYEHSLFVIHDGYFEGPQSVTTESVKYYHARINIDNDQLRHIIKLRCGQQALDMYEQVRVSRQDWVVKPGLARMAGICHRVVPSFKGDHYARRQQEFRDLHPGY